ncbi:MAG: DUF4426 domain-containing protein [Pseudomonadales bacterium]
MIVRTVWFYATLFVLGLYSITAHAEQMQLFGKYEVHYSLVSTQFISEQVAKAYGITRAKDRKLLNIAVRKRQGENSTIAQRANIVGERSDLMKLYPVQFREVTEGADDQAIYYLSEFRFINREIARFDIRVQVVGQPTMQLEFTKKLYFED